VGKKKERKASGQKKSLKRKLTCEEIQNRRVKGKKKRTVVPRVKRGKKYQKGNIEGESSEGKGAKPVERNRGVYIKGEKKEKGHRNSTRKG